MAGSAADLDLVFLAAKVHANAYDHLHDEMTAAQCVAAEGRIRSLLERCLLLGLKASQMESIACTAENPLLEAPWWNELVQRMLPNQRRTRSPQFWGYAPPT